MGLALAVVVSIIALSGGQLLPENSCPDYFAYVNDPFEGLQGEVTLPAFSRGRNRIDLRFSQRGDQDASAVGAVTPYPDESAVRSSRGSSKFRISLRPNPTGGWPKLTRLTYNNQLLCSASEYTPPNSFFNRFYELQISGSLAPLPSTGFNTFPRDGFDVDVQTVFFPPSRGIDVWPGFMQTWQTTPSLKPQLATPAPTPPVFWPTPGPPLTTESALLPSPIETNSPSMSVQSVRFNPRSPAASIVCGREGSLSPYIVRGKEFPRGMYPWLSAIYHKESRSLAFKCGGSLISASIVISAAHCVYRMAESRVVIGLGRYDLDDYGEDGAEMHNVMRLLWHPEFNTRLLSDADIALITIERPAKFNDIIGPICLWTVEASSTLSTSGFIAGWGRDEQGTSRTQYPRIVEAEIASATNCASNWKASMVSDRSLCAGNRDGSGPCLGDSGGGLMVKQGDRWLLRGIVSSGERGTNGTCQLNQYVLYCDLSKHIDWINDNIR
ncbi:serine protease gd isoform X1 [Drosophila elegans]|uniref:serine protease gd isoform X1 n=1 Tax=Drosophila elegans TaxID=30023 RepID=UPI0007E6DD56|nr:serine protease gd isoform X1 [Drosophila elegans]